MMFSWWPFGRTEKKEENKYNPEHLRQRGKLLQQVDHSWRAKLHRFFGCLGMENARQHAGFTDPNEIIAIKRQENNDKQQLLQNKEHLKKRHDERLEVDNSWTAFFCGTTYARTKAGFELDENNALDKWREENLALFAPFNRLLNRIENSTEPTRPVKSNRIKAIEAKQTERIKKYL